MEKLHFGVSFIENEILDDEILVIGFHHEEHYLMIQLGLEFDEQDIRLGMNTYHIERDDQSYGNYGGVERVILQPTQIHFLLNQNGKNNLQCEEVLIDFNIELDEQDYNHLAENLQRIFGEALTVMR